MATSGPPLRGGGSGSFVAQRRPEQDAAAGLGDADAADGRERPLIGAQHSAAAAGDPLKTPGAAGEREITAAANEMNASAGKLSEYLRAAVAGHDAAAGAG